MEFPLPPQVRDHRGRFHITLRNRTVRNTCKSYFKKNCKIEIWDGRTHSGIPIRILGETSSSEMSKTTKTSDRPKHIQKLFLQKRDFWNWHAFLKGGNSLGDSIEVLNKFVGEIGLGDTKTQSDVSTVVEAWEVQMSATWYIHDTWYIVNKLSMTGSNL